MRLGLVAFDAAPHFFAAGLAAGFAGLFFAACAYRERRRREDKWRSTRARAGFLGDFAAGFFGVAFLAAGFRAAGFTAVFFFAGDLAFAAGFLAAGLRLAAAMADVSPVPSEGARALAVDSRVAAPQNDATAGSTRARARPGNSAARKPPAAPGSPRPSGAQTQRNSNWPDDPAARCGRRANQGSATGAPHCGLAWAL